MSDTKQINNNIIAPMADSRFDLAWLGRTYSPKGLFLKSTLNETRKEKGIYPLRRST